MAVFNLNDAIFDAMLKQAAGEVAHREALEFDAFFESIKDDPPHEHSKKYTQAMKRLADQARWRSGRRMRRTILKRVAVFAVVITVAAAALSTPASAFLDKIFALFMVNHQEYTEVNFSTEQFEEDLLNDSGWSTIYLPNWTPLGYISEEPTFIDGVCSITYRNGNEIIRFKQEKLRKDRKLRVDTENADKTKEFKMGNENAILVFKEGKTLAYSLGDTYIYIFSSDLSESQIKKFAKSLKKVE